MRKVLQKTELDEGIKRVKDITSQDEQILSIVEMAKTVLDMSIMNDKCEELKIEPSILREAYFEFIRSQGKEITSEFQDEVKSNVFKEIKNLEGELIYTAKNKPTLDKLIEEIHSSHSLAIFLTGGQKYTLEEAIEFFDSKKSERDEKIKAKQDAIDKYVNGLVEKHHSTRKAYEEIIYGNNEGMDEAWIEQVKPKLRLDLDISKEVESWSYLKERLAAKPFGIYLKEAKEESRIDLPVMKKICNIGQIHPKHIDTILCVVLDYVREVADKEGLKFRYKDQESFIALALILACSKKIVNTSNESISELMYFRYMFLSLEKKNETDLINIELFIKNFKTIIKEVLLSMDLKK